MNEEILKNLQLFAPELWIVLSLCVLFLLDGFIPKVRESVVPLFITIIACLFGMALTYKSGVVAKTEIFSRMAISDGLVNFFRYIFFFACGVTAYLTLGSKEVEERGRTEFGLLILCVTFGMSLMAVANHLLLLYIGIETVSIISFLMAGFSRESLRSNEAAFKYLVYGALASGLMIYGISLLYAYTGSLYYTDIATALTKVDSSGHPSIFWLSLILIYSGLAYKISAFPMHFWAPDVYEGAPTPIVTFFSVGPKAAGFAAILHFVLGALATKDGENWKPILGDNLSQVIAVISACTMIVGNLSAVGQTNVKRILAFSSIAHVGYMLMGLIGLTSFGVSSILFYLVAYCAMNIGAFWVVGIVSDLKGREDLSAFSGLGWQMPLVGVSMAVFLFSLTGIPMFSGFIGKFLLFGSLIKTQGYLWLAILGVLNSVVSLYYYVKILKAMWLEKPEAETASPKLSVLNAVGLVGLAVPTIWLGLFFGPVVQFVQTALTRF